MGVIGNLASWAHWRSKRSIPSFWWVHQAPWSHAMRNLTTETGLRYATDGYGIWPTWFVGQSFVGPLLGAPLDHILLSPQWQVIDYTESGDIGSDHVPLQADLILQSEK